MRFWGEIRANSDILALIGMLVIMILLISFGIDGPLRVISGITLILFLPGYVLQAALFPKDKEINPMERVILSFALSAAVVPLIILILNYTPWGIRIYPVIITLCIYMTVFCSIILYRRSKILREKRFNMLFALNMTRLHNLPRWQGIKLLDKVFIIALLLTVIFTGVSFHIFAATPKSMPSSEFYMVNPEGDTHGGFGTIKNEEMEVILGVVNRERKNTGYTIKVNINGNTKKIIGPFYLNDSEKWEDTIEFALPKYQTLMKTEFMLIKNSDQHTYRSIHLWINNLNNK